MKTRWGESMPLILSDILLYVSFNLLVAFAFCLFLWFFANNTVFLLKTADPRVESSLFMLH